MKLQIYTGLTDVTLQVFINDTTSATGAGLTGLVWNTSGLVCYYDRGRTASAQLALASVAVAGAHTDGGFVEIDATNMPGWYRLDLSDAIVATGVDVTYVQLQGAANMAPCLIEIQLDTPTGMDICWGHDTGVLEAVIHNFEDNWTGTGQIDNPGVADTERLALETTEYMISEVVNTGAVSILIDYNVYAVGDDIDLDYRHGATTAACLAAAWNNYVAPFTSLGYVQVRVTSTL